MATLTFPLQTRRLRTFVPASHRLAATVAATVATVVASTRPQGALSAIETHPQNDVEPAEGAADACVAGVAHLWGWGGAANCEEREREREKGESERAINHKLAGKTLRCIH